MKKEDILECIARGMSNEETYKYLKISKSTLLRKCKLWDISFSKSKENIQDIVTYTKLKNLADKRYTLIQAAKELGVSRSFLAKKAKEFKISFNKNKFNLDKYHELKNENLSDKEISKYFKITQSGLYKRKLDYNLEIEKRNFFEVPKENLEKLYLHKKLDISEISKKLNKSVTAIYAFLKKYDIPLRRDDGATLKKDKLVYLLSEGKTYTEISESCRMSEDAVKKAIIRNSLDTSELFSKEGNSLNKFSEIQKQLIYGSLLGDAYLENSHTNSYLKFEHGHKQKEYIEYKFQILKNFTQNVGLKDITRFDKRTEKNYKAVYFKTIQSKVFSDIYHLFYNPKKYINRNVLDVLDGRGLAFWFMDDGYKYNNYSLALCTESFTEQDIATIVLYFKEKWDITCSANKGRIFFIREEASKFQSIISLYILPFFKYKLIDTAHQKLIKDKLLKGDTSELLFDYKSLKTTDFIFNKEEYSEEINNFIKKYEWLGKTGNSVKWVFTARYQGLLAGVILLNEPASYSRNLLAGIDTSSLETLIQRGCSASWTPKNLGSSLIMFSLNWMVRNTSKRIFVGYADTGASEFGILYQACNFDYLGNTFGAKYLYQNPKIKEGNFFSRQTLSRTSSLKKWCNQNNIEFKKEWLKENGYKDITKIPKDILKSWKKNNASIINNSFKMKIPPKGKYVLVLGRNSTDQKYLNKLKNYKKLPYPKKNLFD